MTFSVLLIKDDRTRLVGTLWANDEANARALIPALWGCAEGQVVTLRRSEDREIPLRICSTQAIHFT